MAPRKTAKKASAPAAKTAEHVVETKEVEKKTAPKKTCKTNLCVEMDGLSVSVADVQTAIKKVVKEKGLEASELNIYIKAEEQAAYYTVDGEGGAEYKVDLKTL